MPRKTKTIKLKDATTETLMFRSRKGRRFRVIAGPSPAGIMVLRCLVSGETIHLDKEKLAVVA